MAERLDLIITLENGKFKVASKDSAKAIDKIGKETKKTEKQTGKLSKSFNFLKGAVVGFLAAGVAGKLIDFFKSSVKAASDLQETTAKFNTVFKTTGKDMGVVVHDLTKNFAMSTRESRAYLSSMQDLLVPMGMLPDQAAMMSEEVVKLAADLGSFNNLPTAQVMADIQSAMVGNFETMKKYGVVLNETVIRQEAINMGFNVGKGVIDANVKAQVAYKLAVEGSKFAIGDLARTQDSYANRMKKTTALIEDMKAAMGEEMMNTLADLSGAFNETGEDAIQFAKDTGQAIGALIKLGHLAWQAALIVSGVATQQTIQNLHLEEQKEGYDKLGNSLSFYIDQNKKIDAQVEKSLQAQVKKRKIEKESAAGKGKKADPFMQEFEQRKFALQAYQDYKLEIDEFADLREQTRAQQAVQYHEQVLRNKLMLDSRYAQGMTTVMSTASTFMAQKQKGLFRFGQALAISQSLMNTFQGATKAMAQWGWPWGLVAAGIIGTAGALQVGMIAKQKPPKPPPTETKTIAPAFAEGSFNVPKTTQATVHAGEIITPAPMAEAIRKGEASLSGGGDRNIIVQGSIIDTAQLIDITDDLRNERAASMGTDNYSFRGVYK